MAYTHTRLLQSSLSSCSTIDKNTATILPKCRHRCSVYYKEKLLLFRSIGFGKAEMTAVCFALKKEQLLPQSFLPRLSRRRHTLFSREAQNLTVFSTQTPPPPPPPREIFAIPF